MLHYVLDPGTNYLVGKEQTFLGTAVTLGCTVPWTSLSSPKIILSNIGKWLGGYFEPVAASVMRVLLEKRTSRRKAGTNHTGHVHSIFVNMLFQLLLDLSWISWWDAWSFFENSIFLVPKGFTGKPSPNPPLPAGAMVNCSEPWTAPAPSV